MIFLYVSFPVTHCDAPSESKSKTLAVQARVAALEDDKAALQQSLAGERDALASARQSVTRLQRDLSELQTVSTAAASLAATDKVSHRQGVPCSGEDDCAYESNWSESRKDTFTPRRRTLTCSYLSRLSWSA